MLALATLATLALSAQALLPHHDAHHRRHNGVGRASYVPRSTSYNLVKEFAGQSFFDDWYFDTDADPTHGLVQFVGGSDASKLAYVQDDGTAVIAVDQGATVGNGLRKSIRISTKDSWSTGLFIADIYSMPHGCSVWPAYWSIGNGQEWPNAGEIDIIENINLASQNQITLHSGPGCTLEKTQDALANLVGTTCESSNGNNAGCAYVQQGNNSFGHLFNMMAGGVFAHTLESDGINVWFFPRDQVPADITAKTPDPSTWGTPTAAFPNTQCDILSHFLAQSLIFDITLCGDWAGAAYPSSGCPGTCAQAVANASNFDVAQWKIGSVRIYQ